MSIAIRRLTPGEVSESLLAAVGHPKVWAADPDGCIARARAHADNDNRLIAIAYDGTQPVGAAEAQDYGTSIWRSNAVIRMHDLFVIPELRRQGIGRQLVNEVLTWARARPDAGFIQWQASKPAVPFYESLGLTPDYVSDVPDYPFFIIDLRTEAPHIQGH
jgi:GNAT superfamily N-acetyltransferase